MIPIRDDAPRSTVPFITWLIVAINALFFLFEVSLSPAGRTTFIYQFGVVPAATIGPASLGIAGAIVPMFTSMFLHASWLHLIGNMWALWIFGDNIEDHLGHFRYLLLYLICGIAANFAHVVFNPGSTIPTVGASGAIAGVMGAYFLLFPAARVLTVVPFVFMFIWLPAWIVLAYWFIVQFLSGAAGSITGAGAATGGVAFWAHVGGFIAGVTLIKLFPARTPQFSLEE